MKKISVYSKDDPENNMTEYRVIKETLYRKSAQIDVINSLVMILASINIYWILEDIVSSPFKYFFIAINIIGIIINIWALLKKPLLGTPTIIEIHNNEIKLEP